MKPTEYGKRYQYAAERVEANPSLQPYVDILLEYEWDNESEHLDWLITADIDEILDWCEAIREGEQE